MVYDYCNKDKLKNQFIIRIIIFARTTREDGIKANPADLFF